jgi:hypothetical protein
MALSVCMSMVLKVSACSRLRSRRVTRAALASSSSVPAAQPLLGVQAGDSGSSGLYCVLTLASTRCHLPVPDSSSAGYVNDYGWLPPWCG